MSTRTRLRQALIVLGVTGSLMPWAGSMPSAVTPGGSAPQAARDDALHGAARLDLRRTWSWPLDPRPAVKAPFVPPRSAYGAGHRGIDVVGSQGQQVLAVDAGVVTHVGVVAGRGTVSVTHADGLRSTYEPVRGEVATGSTVAQGQVLGSLHGRSHCGASCLHLGALLGPRYLDPRPLLSGGPVILLPLEPSG